MKEDEHLYQRNGVWYARCNVNGNQIRQSLKTRSYKEASTLLERWLRHVKGDFITWETAVGRYLTEAAPGALKPDVVTRYACSLGQVGPWLEGIDVREIDTRTIAKVVSERKRMGVTNATVKRDLTAVSRVLSACVGWGWICENAARTFDRSIVRERRDPIVLPTDVEIVDTIAAATARAPVAGALLRFLQATGMRLNEAAKLEWPHVDLEGRRVTLTRTKTDRARVVPLSAEAVLILKGRQRHPRSDFVFWHAENSGACYAEFSSVFRQFASVEWSCHDLRHRYAVDYLLDGGNIYVLQKMMGHSSIRTTELYLDYLTPDEAMRSRYGENNIKAGC